MSEKSSEFLKKTCIVCGCHTNQTINIYEPRSGPNIVQLIQARFKFQPLNEDKYLCYSCNNWLINWHSLQTMNSNDSEQSSGNFRSSQMNNIGAEKGSSAEGTRTIQSTKPIAHIRPRVKNQLKKKSSLLPKVSSCSTKRRSNLFSKRTVQISPRLKKFYLRRKLLHNCCQRLYRIMHSNPLTQPCSNIVIAKGKKCSMLIELFNMYLNTILLPNTKHENPSRQNYGNLVSGITDLQLAQNRYHEYKNPQIDGKVVSMLRRLGTTLSRDATSAPDNYQPPIMSPQKKKRQIWTRDISDNEILINFNTAITEVLPIEFTEQSKPYHVSNRHINREPNGGGYAQDHTTDDSTTSLECIFNSIPKGLTISVISGSNSSVVN